jgi:hypothetical protein
VPRFLDSFPDIALDVVLDAGADAEWDVAIRAGKNEDPKLGARLLGAPPAVLCATPAYLQKHPAPDRPEGLRDHALLTPAGEGAEYRFQMTKASARAEVRVRPKLAVDDPRYCIARRWRDSASDCCPSSCAGRESRPPSCARCSKIGRRQRLRHCTPCFPPVSENDPRVRSFVEFAAANIVPALAH